MSAATAAQTAIESAWSRASLRIRVAKRRMSLASQVLAAGEDAAALHDAEPRRLDDDVLEHHAPRGPREAAREVAQVRLGRPGALRRRHLDRTRGDDAPRARPLGDPDRARVAAPRL